jgi:coproporphyrinogen III oxidase
MYTHSRGSALPPAATERNPDLAGRPFEAVALSLITHPCNPHVPTTHMNLRFFHVEDAHRPVWYFGGGFDLTPVYAYEEDCRHWHRVARDACAGFGCDVYPTVKRACDDYFYLPHRQECRGVGGIFFDDWTRGGFANSFAFVRSVGEAFLAAYVPIVERRRATAYGDRERDFQLYRRGRYAEFNLAIDRGTRYGMQSGRRIESVLASLPPVANWRYDWQPPAGSREAELASFLKPRDWVSACG